MSLGKKCPACGGMDDKEKPTCKECYGAGVIAHSPDAQFANGMSIGEYLKNRLGRDA